MVISGFFIEMPCLKVLIISNKTSNIKNKLVAIEQC